jgi:hypothetical protein
MGGAGSVISAPSTFSLWGTLDGCRPPATRTTLPRRAADGTSVQPQRYGRCRAGAAVELFAVAGGGVLRRAPPQLTLRGMRGRGRRAKMATPDPARRPRRRMGCRARLGSSPRAPRHRVRHRLPAGRRRTNRDVRLRRRSARGDPRGPPICAPTRSPRPPGRRWIRALLPSSERWGPPRATPASVTRDRGATPVSALRSRPPARTAGQGSGDPRSRTARGRTSWPADDLAAGPCADRSSRRVRRNRSSRARSGAGSDP